MSEVLNWILMIFGLITIVMLANLVWYHLDPRATRVHLRTNDTPVDHWVARVEYDAWGTPYVEGQYIGSGARCRDRRLFPNGSTEDYVYTTEWRHKSGPPVKFDIKPHNNAFGD